MRFFKKIFPPGVINTICGSGRVTMPAMLKTGKVDIFAFIGSSSAADSIQKSHPAPHKLRICLGLDAKNPAIVLPDADLKIAVEQCILGSLSFNGQRCTAIKIIFVHESIADKFNKLVCESVDKMKIGLPFDKDTKITPLPEDGKPSYLETVTKDAEKFGAKVINSRGGHFFKTYVFPTILYPVTKQMRCYNEEQFGPLIPIVPYKSLDEVYEYCVNSKYGQQASIFGTDPNTVGKLIDVLVNQVSRVNLNTQCQRGPDSLPFTGRKDSAYGTLSLGDALRVFSIRSLVCTAQGKTNENLVSQIVQGHNSNFLRLDYLF